MIARMKRHIRFLSVGIILLFLMPASLIAQFGNFTIIPCTDSAGVVALIDTVFLKGVDPSQINNITFKGNPEAVGYFYDGFMFEGVQTKKGIVMSTGNAVNLAQDNSCTVDQNSTTNGGSDIDLNMISSGIFDACVIEFDFKPTNQISSFRYIFGSEEYPEYVGGSFNDVFGFFLMGWNNKRIRCPHWKLCISDLLYEYDRS